MARSFGVAMRDSEVNITTNETSFTHGLDGVNQDGNYFFINTLVVFFFVLCGVCLLFRLYKSGNNYIRQIVTAGGNGDHQAVFAQNQTSVWPWIKGHILYAPLFRKRHNKEIQLSSAVSIGTLPSRLHTILLTIYVLSNIAYCCVLDYSANDRAATIAELRGRSGALAAINILPTILFAMRNNPFIPLLNISYDTFNLFHRWTARIVIVESLIHVCAWMVNAIEVGGSQYMSDLMQKSASFQWGAVAVAVFLMISVQACSPVRHAFYETFITGHRILVLVALIGVYIHLDLAHLPQLPYIWLAGLIWITEWVFRTGRIVYFNYRRKRQTTVMVEAFDTGACRLTFDLVRPWTFRPGAHVHIYLPSIGLLGSHPFSIAWSQDIKKPRGTTPTSSSNRFSLAWSHIAKPQLGDTLPTTTADLDDRYAAHTSISHLPEAGFQDIKMSQLGDGLATPATDLDDRVTSHTSISLIVRARQGMTRKLYDKASSAPNKIITMHGAIEGPYGGHESLDSYGTVLLFAAGVGITHQLGYVRHLLAGAAAGTVSARRIVLVWSIPNRECMEWVAPWMDEVLAMPRRTEFLRVYNYISKGSEVRVVSGSGTVATLPGRCEPGAIVDEVFGARVGGLVVTVCGPGVFADAVRGAVRRRVEAGSLDFVEEAFTY